MVVKGFLANYSMVEISRPPYLPNLMFTNFLSILLMKPPSNEDFRMSRINKKNVTTILNALPLDTSDACFLQLLEKCKK
jgi:hypothetical protein